MMDENFAGFLNDFGPPHDCFQVPQSALERYRGRLPDQLLEYWYAHGWCGYADGLFWTVNPQDFEPALEAWIGDTPFMETDAYHIIARSAFGDLYLWGEQGGFTLKVCPLGSFAAPRKPGTGSMDQRVQRFFGNRTRAVDDFSGLFEIALKTLGRLKADEMYGFVPALALGGQAKLENLEKVKAVYHLVLLAQLSKLEILSAPPG